MKPRVTKASGFTLIEVVLSLGLLLLGATVILSLLSFGAGMARTARLSALTALAVEAVVRDLEEGLFPLEADGGAGEPRSIEARPVPGRAELVYFAWATPRGALDGDGPGPGGTSEYQVDVEIRWSATPEARGRRFSVLLLREVPFGERMRRALARPPDDSGAATEGKDI